MERWHLWLKCLKKLWMKLWIPDFLRWPSIHIKEAQFRKPDPSIQSGPTSQPLISTIRQSAGYVETTARWISQKLEFSSNEVGQVVLKKMWWNNTISWTFLIQNFSHKIVQHWDTACSFINKLTYIWLFTTSHFDVPMHMYIYIICLQTISHKKEYIHPYF